MDKEIFWNIINSLLAGSFVFVGAFSDGDITTKGIVISLVASLSVAISQFKDYWNKEEPEYCGKKRKRKIKKLGAFIP